MQRAPLTTLASACTGWLTYTATSHATSQAITEVNNAEERLARADRGQPDVVKVLEQGCKIFHEVSASNFALFFAKLTQMLACG